MKKGINNTANSKGGKKKIEEDWNGLQLRTC